MPKKFEIRNSTAEFLIFQIEGKGQGVEVYYKDKTVWCTQKAMGVLFDCSTDNIGVHLGNIYDTGELKKESTAEKISVVRREGNRDFNKTLQFCNLDAIIAVGYRVNSIRAIRLPPVSHKENFLNKLQISYQNQSVLCKNVQLGIFSWVWWRCYV